MLSVGEHCQIRIWDTENLLEPESEVRPQMDSILTKGTLTDITHHRSEPQIATCAAYDRSVILYDTRETRPMRKVIMDLRTNAISWNPMEAFVFLAANEDYNVYSFDVR